MSGGAAGAGAAGRRTDDHHALECRGVTVGYGQRLVVSNLDLELGRGQMLALLGPSGSGKTTILSALAGFIPIRSGEIWIGGRQVAGPRRHDPPEARDVAVVFQGYALWPHLTAIETVAYPIRRRGVGPDAARREAAAILDRLGVGHLGARRPAEMSGGEQQRIGLGRALARRSGLQLFDEPTAHLDAELRERLLGELADQRRESGAAGIYATHDTAEALALADRVALVRDGRVVQLGSPREVYDTPVDLWAARLTGPATDLPATVLDCHDGRADLALGGTTVTVAVSGAGALPDRDGPRPVRILVRPDWASLGGPLAAVVESVAFRGTHTDYRLASAAGIVGIRQGGPPRASVGDRVGWTLERVWFVEPPDEARDDGR